MFGDLTTEARQLCRFGECHSDIARSLQRAHWVSPIAHRLPERVFLPGGFSRYCTNLLTRFDYVVLWLSSEYQTEPPIAGFDGEMLPATLPATLFTRLDSWPHSLGRFTPWPVLRAF